VVLLDWKLPELSGPELCRFLRQRFDEGALPILLLTVLSTGENVAEALAAGANDFLSKPFEDVVLRARVKSALRTKQLFARARLAEQALDRERIRLQESEAKLRRLAESGIMGILIMDLAGNVLEANDTLLEMIGYGRADLAAGRVRMRELTSSDHLAADDRAVRELLENGVCKRYEKVIERPDGSQIVVLQGAALLGRETAIGYLLDVSEHRSLEADRRRLYDAERRARGEAERASLMKDEFLATVSHELRTPLNAILGWSQLARTRSKGAELDKALDTIERNARAQARLIEDILDISRIVSGKVRLELAEVDLSGVVSQTLEAVGPAASVKGIELRDKTRPVAVLADPSRLQQIVWNLLTNAIKFTPPGGWVEVSIQSGIDRVTLVVKDCGRGIGADFLPHVFDRFRQADPSTTRSHGGLGLGLSIVHHLVEQHGGRVYAASPGPDQGATFSVELPLRVATEQSPSRIDQPSPKPPRTALPAPASLRGIRVLVVEDDGDSRAFLGALLEQHGAEVIASDSVRHAVGVFEKNPPDVVVTDIAMSVEDGYDLLRQIRALPVDRGGQVPAVALTAYARVEDQKRALSEGFQLHLTKPVNVESLIDAVSTLHREHCLRR
jgi:PAS domain S-box-containing protein